MKSIHQLEPHSDLLMINAIKSKKPWKIDRKQLTVIFYDFDGVMTDNRVLQFQDGTEAVVVNRADGMGTRLIGMLGIPQFILSTEKNPVVAARARKLKLGCIQGCADKRAAIVKYCEMEGISLEGVLFVGNDVNDKDGLLVVGYPVCPSDASPPILAICPYRLDAKGGDGTIRELADRIR